MNDILRKLMQSKPSMEDEIDDEVLMEIQELADSLLGDSLGKKKAMKISIEAGDPGVEDASIKDVFGAASPDQESEKSGLEFIDESSDSDVPSRSLGSGMEYLGASASELEKNKLKKKLLEMR
jgi:hypothetical protein